MDKNKFYKAMFNCCDNVGILSGVNYCIENDAYILTASDGHLLVRCFLPLDFAPADFNGETKASNGCSVDGKFPNVNVVIPNSAPKQVYEYKSK